MYSGHQQLERDHVETVTPRLLIVQSEQMDIMKEISNVGLFMTAQSDLSLLFYVLRQKTKQTRMFWCIARRI